MVKIEFVSQVLNACILPSLCKHNIDLLEFDIKWHVSSGQKYNWYPFPLQGFDIKNLFSFGLVATRLCMNGSANSETQLMYDCTVLVINTAVLIIRLF